jgi:hypothetical protein
MNIQKTNRFWIFRLFILLLFCAAGLVQAGWERQNVDWLAGAGGRIKSISYPQQNSPKLFSGPAVYSGGFKLFNIQEPNNTINSPPVAGFVPYIAVAVTNKRSSDDDFVAQTHLSVVGNYLTNSPQKDFTIGLFDTGASTHIISNEAANRTGIFNSSLVTSNTVELLGATHSVFGIVSQPLGIFMDGLSAIDPGTKTLNDSNMVGQSNVSIIVGDVPGPNEPDLPTAIGSPMSVNFVTAIFNDHQVYAVYDGNNYTAPDIQFYDFSDPAIPDYAGSIPLQLIPAGAADIEYLPDFESIFDFVFQPGSP